MDGLSSAASVVAVIDISAKITSLCFQYSIAVKNAKRDIERLQKQVECITSLVGKLKQLSDGPAKSKLTTIHGLSDSLNGCLRDLAELKEQLDPGNGRKAMSRLGLRALKWPFTSKQVEKIISELGRYEQTFSAALQADQIEITLNVDQNTDNIHQKLDLAKLPRAKGAPFNSHMDEHNARCLANTRMELRRQISEWAQDRNGKPIFWLKGMAGTGKSTIARTVSESFNQQGKLGASFFFKRGEGERGNATRFFTTIASDLTGLLPGLIPSIRKALDANPTIPEMALKDQFEQLILLPLSDLHQGHSQTSVCFVVIDALDECEREEDIRAILQLLARTKDMRPVSLRILVTSRPELPIRLGFKQMSDGTYQDLVLHDVPRTTIKHDIALYFKHELETVREQRSLSLDWPSKENIDALVELAIPLFIFAATVCRYIADGRDNPKRRMQVILQYQPTTSVSKLDRTYLPILNQLFDDEDEADKQRRTREFRDLVGSIVVLESPLSIPSLGQLLQLPIDDIRCRLDPLHSVLSIPANEDLPIRLLHLSFRDFLVDTEKQGKSLFWVDERDTHETLVSRCLELMSSPKGLRQNICDIPMAGTQKSEVDRRTEANWLPHELQYACRYWVHHLKQSKRKIYSGDVVHSFLKKYLLYWLEVMSLIEDAHICVNLIARLQELVNDSSKPVLNFLYDAKRFTLRFRPILEDTPLQLYSAGLIFAPEGSIMKSTFSNHIPSSIRKLSKVEDDWDACHSLLEGHSDAVSAVSFSADGQLVASASRDNTVRLWEAATGSCRSTLEGHSNAVSAVSFSPDGQLVASASRDNTVRLWETATGSCCSILEGHSSCVSAVSFSPDGQLVASASRDNTIRLWEAATGSCCSTLEGHSDAVSTVSFSPDGQLVASASSDNTVRLWEAVTGSCRSTLEGHSGAVSAVSFSPDGQLVASASHDNTVRLWEAATGSCCSTLEGHSSWVSAVAFSPDGQLVASASYDNTVRLWEAATWSCRSTLEDHSNVISAVAFSPDGQLVASTSYDKTIRLWEAATGSCRSTLKGHSSWVSAVAFSPDGQLVASASRDNTVRLWEAATGSFCSTLEGHSGWIFTVAFSPDGQLVASASYDNTIRLWEAATGSCRSTLEGQSNEVLAVAFSPDGQLVASASRDNTIQLWEAATGSCRSTLEGHSGAVFAVSFSPDGQLVASVSNSTVKVWEVATGSCRSTLEGHSGAVFAVSFSPDGQLVASVSNSTVKVWEAATGSCRSTLEGQSNEVLAVAFSPDGQLVASASRDNTVRLWEAATGSCCNTLEGHSGAVFAVSFSPDGQLVASVSYNTVKLWEVATGLCRSTLGGLYSEVSAIAFSPGGKSLQTNRGCIPLLQPHIETSSSEDKKSSNLFIHNQWVQRDQQSILWLPLEYRHRLSTVYKDIICLVHSSGRLFFLKITSE